MNITYCDKICPIGSKKSEEFLDKSNSAFDAAINFSSFIHKCFETCPYRVIHKDK